MAKGKGVIRTMNKRIPLKKDKRETAVMNNRKKLIKRK